MKSTSCGPEAIIAKKKQFLIPCVYHFYQNPPQIVRGSMQYLYDHRDRRYLDFYAGVSVVNAGHCNPDITAETCRQATLLQHTTTIYLTQPIVALAEKLAGLAPGPLTKSFFCNSGSEANEGALLLARLATGKKRFVSLDQSLHGRTHMTMSVTGLPLWRTDPAPSPDVAFIPSAYCYRCALDARYPACGLACARLLEKALAGPTQDVAAVIAEPIAGNGGILVPPPGYFELISQIAQKHGVLFICDEVQTGFGRTGKTFGIENWSAQPDIITAAKALANGLPVGAFLCSAQVASAYTRPGASTLGGNPVTARTALATLDYHAQQDLANKALGLGKYFKQELLALQDRHPGIGDVRGLGLMLGAELVLPDKSPAAQETDLVLELMKDRGVLIGKTGRGRNVLTFQPPLVITRDNIDEVIAAADDALTRIAGRFC